MIKQRLQATLKEALKARDKIRLDTVRSVLSAMQYEAMEKKIDELTDEANLSILQRELKKRKEEVDFAIQAKRPDLLDKLKVEISTLEEFLPSQLTSEDIEKELVSLKDSAPGINMGAAMKSLRDKYPGRFDGKIASEIAKRIFN